MDVELVGVTHEGIYEIDGNTVTVVAPNGARTPLTIASNGCLEGRGLVGAYCKDGSGASASSGARSSLSEMSRAYEATVQEGRITLEFGGKEKVQLTMVPFDSSGAPERMSFEGGYDVKGAGITITIPGNESLLLTRVGDDLEGTMNGETVRFERK